MTTRFEVRIELASVRLYRYDAAFDVYEAVRYEDGSHVTVTGDEARAELLAMRDAAAEEAEAEAHEQAMIDAANAYVSPVDAERY